MVAEGKYLCGASLHGFPVWMNSPTLFMFYLFIYLFICLFVLLFAKYCIQDGHPPTVSVL